MPECPICRQQYDEQFSVFVPPHPEAFDTVECAKLAMASWGAAAAPVILPTIEVVPAPPVAKPVAGVPGRGIAALAVLALVPGQAALAGGVGLAAAGTAAAIYLAAKPALAPQPEAAGTGSSQAPEISTGGSTGGSPAGLAQGMPAARPPDAIHAGPRISRRRPHAVVATAHVAHVTGGSSTRSSSPQSSAQLISRTIPVTQKPAPTPQNPTPPGEQQTPAPSPTSAPKPRKPKPSPQQPPTTPAAPTAPVPTPTGGAEVTGTRVLASTDSTPRPSKDENKPPKPPKDQPPPAQTPPPVQQPPPGSDASPGDSDDRPGNGYGDKNHDHSGPPGHEGDNGNGHGGGHGGHH
jgi:hypothetical protein